MGQSAIADISHVAMRRLTENSKRDRRHRNPVEGINDPVIPPIGKLATNGPVIKLPCWFSQIYPRDNPSLCAVDSYNISRDRVRFLGRVNNRPDLVPIAKTIEYGEAHDYPAVRAYCDTPEVAEKIVRNVPPFVFAGAALKVTRITPLKERVEIGDDQVFQFDIEKHGAGWWSVFAAPTE